MFFGEPGLVLGRMGVEGWQMAAALEHKLAESLVSPFRISSLSDLSVSPSKRDVNVLISGMLRRRDRFFLEDFFVQSFFLESITVLPICLQSEFFFVKNALQSLTYSTTIYR